MRTCTLKIVTIFICLLAVTIAKANPAETILDNLVLYVPFDEGTGVITYDYSGNGYHGTLFSNTINQVDKWSMPTANDNHWTTGRWGNALRGYNGTFYNNENGNIMTKDVISAHVIGKGIYVEPWADNPSLGTKIAQDWSYSFWVRRATNRSIALTSSWVNVWSLDPAKTISDAFDVDWWAWGGGLQYDHLHTRYDSQYQTIQNRQLQFMYSAGGGMERHAIGNPLGVPENTNGNGLWQNIIITVDGDPAADGGGPNRFTFNIYVNGVLTGTKIQDSNGGWGHLPTEAFTIGGPQEIKGIGLSDDVDDVAVWNRLLTAQEIVWIQGNPIKPTPPQGPVTLMPYNNGIANPSGKLTWEAGPGGPFASYDIYLSTSLQDVQNATRNPAMVCAAPPIGDIDGDCAVDIYDLEAIADCWLEPASCEPAADLLADNVIQLSDFNILSQYWATSTPLTPSYHPAYKGNQAGSEYNFSGLTVDQTYYWRVDGVKSGGEIGRGNIRNFTVKPVWKQTEFVNYMGWTELRQFTESQRTPYAQALYNMGIRHAQDHGESIAYFNPIGIDVFLYYNPTPGEVAFQYRNTSGNAGYFQYDEPKNGSTGKTMADVANYHQQCYDADPSRPSYTNLYSSDGVGGGMSGLQTYINTFFAAFTGTCQPEILSYDYYSYRYGLTNHFSNLEVFRTNALNKGIPLWTWVETSQGSMSTVPASATNRNRMRFCMYSSLAYGVKGFAWFNIEKAIYAVKTPSDPGYGNRTYALGAAYYDVQAVNAEINRLGAQMVPLTSIEVYHTNSPNSYTRSLPSNFWVQVTQSNSGFVVGTFKNPQNKDFVMIHNKSDSTTVSNKQVAFQNTVVNTVSVFNEQNGNWESLAVQGTYPNQYVEITMGPGYGKLLKIN